MVGRVDVEADDLSELGRDWGSLDSLNRADQMGPQAMSTPDPLYRTDADPSGLRHRRAGPMAGGLRPGQSGPQSVSATSGRSGGMRGTRLVAPKPRHAFLAEPFLPAPNHRLGFAGGPHDVGSAMTIGRQKHNLRPPNVLLRAVAVGRHRLKLAAVGGTQSNVGLLAHSSDSHTRVHQRMPKRIEMSDLVH